MGLILFFLFILIPIAEIFVIIQVGQLIGVGPTLALMVLSAVVGAYLARSQGRQTWAKFNSTMRSGKVPGREVMDGAMIIFGGALLLTPGFLTDLLGISLLLPPSRAAYRRLVKAAAARTPTGRPVFFVYDRMPGTGGGRSGGERRGPGAGGATAAALRRYGRRRPVTSTGAPGVSDSRGSSGWRRRTAREAALGRRCRRTMSCPAP